MCGATWRPLTFSKKGFLMNTSIKSIKTAVAFLVGATIIIGALSACNTIEGAGQDIKSGGKAIEKTADDNK